MKQALLNKMIEFAQRNAPARIQGANNNYYLERIDSTTMTCNSSAACCACEAPSYGTVATPPKGGKEVGSLHEGETPTPSHPALSVRTLHIRGGGRAPGYHT